MKRMEELIHLNKKIHFEGKVREAFEGSSYYHIFVFFFFIKAEPASFLCRSFLLFPSHVGW